VVVVVVGSDGGGGGDVCGYEHDAQRDPRRQGIHTGE